MNYLKTFLPYLFGNKKGRSLESSLPSPHLWPSLSFEERLMFETLSNRLDSFFGSLSLGTLSEYEMFHLFNFLNKRVLNLHLDINVPRPFVFGRGFLTFFGYVF
jgi:hypothetical protein